MKAKFRAYGGFAVGILLAVTAVVIILQANREEMWMAILLTSAFSLGMFIYGKSNYTEKKRLTDEKAKRKGGKKK